MKLISPADIYQQAGGRKGLAGWTYHNAELTHLEMAEECALVVGLEDAPAKGTLREVNEQMSVG